MNTLSHPSSTVRKRHRQSKRPIQNSQRRKTNIRRIYQRIIEHIWTSGGTHAPVWTYFSSFSCYFCSSSFPTDITTMQHHPLVIGHLQHHGDIIYDINPLYFSLFFPFISCLIPQTIRSYACINSLQLGQLYSLGLGYIFPQSTLSKS